MNDIDPKSKLWVLTINTLLEADLPHEIDLCILLETLCDDYAFQKEKGEETGNLHYQCALKLTVRKRKQTLLNAVEKIFPGKAAAFQFEKMYGTFNEAVIYATKADSRVGAPVSTLPLYSGVDVEFLNERDRRHPWQVSLLAKLCLPHHLRIAPADDRTIFWITDQQGNSGKSKFAKWLCLYARNTIKVAFGTTTQMRNSLIEAGPKQLYIIDIPRTLGSDECMLSLFSLLEDLKNGFLVSSMYGKNKQLFMSPPHVVVFTNQNCPTDKLSIDRWEEYFIDHRKRLIEAEIYKYNWISGNREEYERDT